MSEYCIVRLNARQDDYSKIHICLYPNCIVRLNARQTYCSKLKSQLSISFSCV